MNVCSFLSLLAWNLFNVIIIGNINSSNSELWLFLVNTCTCSEIEVEKGKTDNRWIAQIKEKKMLWIVLGNKIETVGVSKLCESIIIVIYWFFLKAFYIARCTINSDCS